MPDRVAASEETFRYSGTSMWPCFQIGDLLLVRKVQLGRLRVGDCIVYQRPDEAQPTAHRVVSVSPEIRTRGDSRPVEDDEPVAPGRVMGRVEGRIRHGRLARVSGGMRGAWAGRLLRQAGRLEPSRDSRGGVVARLVQRTVGRISGLWLHRCAVVSFTSAEGRGLSYLLLGRRVVGYYEHGSGRWTLVWPYSLLVDPALLAAPPQPNEQPGAD